MKEGSEMGAKGYGELVLLEKKDRYGIITLNRPDQRNAMNRAAQAELKAALDDSREDCRVLIITGNGPAFCAGIDLKENRALREAGVRERQYAHGSQTWVDTNEEIRKHPAAMIAAVNGFALGGGLTLAHNCELAIASEQAQFGMPEFGFGTFPGLAGPATIRRVLPKHAAYMILTTRRIDAYTAERWGIVNSVVPHDQLLPEAEKLAQHICQFDPILIDFGKKAIRDLDLMPWDDGLVYGGYIGNLVRQQSTASAEGLERFARGEKNPGQGADALRPSPSND
jgi:enoyl-CoA hydratase/carnithine racemase